MTTDSRSFLSEALWMSTGAIIWSVHFLFIYGFNALACGRGFAAIRWIGIGVVPWAVVAATVVAATAMAWFILPVVRHGLPQRFEDWMAATIAGLSLIGILWETVPVLWVPSCG